MRLSYIFLFLLNFNSLGKNSAIEIQVIDEVSKMPVPYASYVRVSDHKGSFAYEEGFFKIDTKLNEPYLVSCIGYLTDTIIPSKSGRVIYLKPKNILLKQVTVHGIKSKEKTYQIGELGGFTLSPYHSSITRKMEMCTYLPSLNDKKQWEIKSIKMGDKIYKNEYWRSEK